MTSAQTIDTPEPRPDLSARADLFRLLARLYTRAVDKDVLTRLAETGFLLDLIDDEQVRARLVSPDEDLVERLQLAHTAIFFGPGDHVPQYASAHHPGEPKGRVLWGDTTVWFRRFVLDHGLSFARPGYQGIPDQIGLELEVYSRFLDTAARLETSGPDEARDRISASLTTLVGTHMRPWIRVFCAAVNTFVQPHEDDVGYAFYGAIAEVTAAAIEDEATRLGLGAPEGEVS